MIAPALRSAIDAPLRDRPSYRVAEIHVIAEREHCSLFAASLAEWTERHASEPDLLAGAH